MFTGRDLSSPGVDNQGVVAHGSGLALARMVTRSVCPRPSIEDSFCSLIAKFHYKDTDTDPTGPARTFFAAKLRWVRAGPVGSV